MAACVKLNRESVENFVAISDENGDGELTSQELLDMINNQLIPGLNTLTNPPIINLTLNQINYYDTDRSGIFDVNKTQRILEEYFEYLINTSNNPLFNNAFFVNEFSRIFGNIEGVQPTVAQPAAAQTNVLDHPLEDYQQCTLCFERLTDNSMCIRCNNCSNWFHYSENEETGCPGVLFTICQGTNNQRCPICRQQWPANCAGQTIRRGPVLERAAAGGKKPNKKRSIKQRTKKSKSKKQVRRNKKRTPRKK
jgi:hypothetical protein